MTNREKLLLILTIFVGLLLGRSLAAQTQGTPSQIKGTGAPSSGLCVAGSVGQEYFQTDATVGQNVFKCTSAGVWTQMSAATGEVQNGQLTYCSSATGNDDYACAISPAFTSYDAGGSCLATEICSGTLINFIADVANNGAATFAPNGLAAKPIRKGGTTTALKSGDIAAGQIVSVTYNRTADVWQYQSQLSIETTGGIPHPFGATFVSSDGSSALTAGATAYFVAPYACTIAAWSVTANAGTATVDIWKVAAGTAIPTSGNTITASATPALSSGTSVRSTTLTGWTTTVSANDIIGINLEVVATASYVNLTVECNN